MRDDPGMPPGEPVEPDPQVLVDIARQKMPFGRYAGTRLIDLPEPYLVWFAKRGFPKGRMGLRLATLYTASGSFCLSFLH